MTKPEKKVAPKKSNNIETAVVQATIGGFKFACRIDSGDDRKAISDTIVCFLGDKGICLPTRFMSEPEKLKAVLGHIVHSKGTAQVSTQIQSVAGQCRLRNIKVKIMEDKDT